ncbi:MAG: cellulase family glycosylhydrolase [Victivallales bacterium]|nr:cellulase family glycosylhydrolase [Victivallales bacterium]
MKHATILLAALGMTAFCAETVTTIPIDDKWTLPSCAKIVQQDGRNIIVVENLDNPKGQKCAKLPFPIEKYAGHSIDFIYEARATDVSVPPESWNGVKLMTHYHVPALPDVWANRPGTYTSGSFPWSKVTVSRVVPPGANKGELLVGLQDSTGKLEVRSIKVVDYGNTEGMCALPKKWKAPEGYKAEYTPRVTASPRLRGAMSPNSYKPEDMEVLASWNANLLRWQLKNKWNIVGACRDIPEWFAWLDKKLEETDKVLNHCAKLGIKVCVDLHGAPGTRNDNKDLYMLYDKKYADAFVEAWRVIARRYKGHPAVWALDLINEPQQLRKANESFLEVQYRAALAIREIDAEVPIVVECNYYDSARGFREMEPFAIKNIIYQVHMYTPGTFTHQGVHSAPPIPLRVYPGVIDNVNWDKEALRKELQPVRDFQLKYGARIYLGEFSAIAWAPGAEVYLRDVISLAEEYEWDWTYHAFREWAGWSVEHVGEDKQSLKLATEETPRKKALLEGFKLNQRAK